MGDFATTFYWWMVKRNGPVKIHQCSFSSCPGRDTALPLDGSQQVCWFTYVPSLDQKLAHPRVLDGQEKTLSPCLHDASSPPGDDHTPISPKMSQPNATVTGLAGGESTRGRQLSIWDILTLNNIWNILKLKKYLLFLWNWNLTAHHVSYLTSPTPRLLEHLTTQQQLSPDRARREPHFYNPVLEVSPFYFCQILYSSEASH